MAGQSRRGLVVSLTVTFALLSCATTQSAKGPPRVRFDEFWKADTNAGFPMVPQTIAGLELRLAQLPKDRVTERRFPDGSRLVLAEVNRTDSQMTVPDMELGWLFLNDKLIAVLWAGAVEPDLSRLILAPNKRYHEDTHDFGRVSRLDLYEKRWSNNTPTQLVASEELNINHVPIGYKRIYRVFDEPAFFTLIAEREATFVKEDALRKQRADEEAKAWAQTQLARLAEKEAEFYKKPLSLLCDAARRLEAKAPLTASGLWEKVYEQSSALQQAASSAKPRGDTSEAERWSQEAVLGLQRTRTPFCAKVFPALDNLSVPTEMAVTFDRQSVEPLVAIAPIWAFCYGRGAFYLGPSVRALGGTPIQVSVEPRAIIGLAEQVVHDDKTYVKDITERQQNPEREKALGPARELARRIRDLQAARAEVYEEANAYANDRSNQVFEGTGFRRDATGQGSGPRVSSFTSKQGGAAMILEGKANERAAALSQEIERLSVQMLAITDNLPPETVTANRTETTVMRHTRYDWKSQLKQRVTIATSPPLVVDVDTPAFLNVEEGRRLLPQRANELLLGSMGDSLVGPFVQRAFTAWVLKRAKAGAFSAPPVPKGLPAEAAAVEKQWSDYYFAGGAKPQATLEMAAWVPAASTARERPTDPNLIASWDQPTDGEFVELGGGFVGARRRLVYPMVLKDFVFELDAEFLGGSPESTLGFCWRGSGVAEFLPSNTYTLGLQWTGNFNVFAVNNDKARSIASGNNGSFTYRPSPLVDRRKNHVRIESRGGHHELQLNGQVLDRVDDSSVTAGRICVDTTGGATVKLSQLSIRAW